jgi:hypothetical protein
MVLPLPAAKVGKIKGGKRGRRKKELLIFEQLFKGYSG